MTLKKYTIPVGISLIISVLVVLSFLNFNKVKAAILNFTPTTCYTAAATSSLAYQTPGAATSTLAGCLLGSDGAQSAVLISQVNASSTNSVNNFFVEESMDNIDWYPINLGYLASTTTTFTVNAPGMFSYRYASSTIGGVPNTTGLLGQDGTNNRNEFVVDIPVRMRYVRAYAACATGGTNCAVWMKIIPRQNVN